MKQVQFDVVKAKNVGTGVERSIPAIKGEPGKDGSGTVDTVAREGVVANSAEIQQLSYSVANHEYRIKAIEEGGGVGTTDYIARQGVEELKGAIGYDSGIHQADFTLTTDKYINQNGYESSRAGNNHTSFISVENVNSISVNFTRTNQYFGFVAFYTENTAYDKNKLAEMPLTSVVANELITVPTNAKFVIVTYFTSDVDQLVVTLFTTPSNDVEKLKETIEDLHLKVVDTPSLTWQDGYYVNPDNGYIRPQASQSLSNLIDLKGVESVSVNFTYAGTQYIKPISFFYDNPDDLTANINYIGSIGCVANEPINIPKYARYMLISRVTAAKDEVVVTITNSAFNDIDNKINNISNGKSVGVFFGDSIMQGVGVLPNNGNIPLLNASHIAEDIMNCKIYNCGIGGTTMTRGSSANFCEIVDAICGTTNWDSIDTEVERLITNNVQFTALRTTVGEVKSLDFNTVDFILVAYGTNDWAYSRPLGENSSTNEGEFIGAMKYALNKIMTAYPHLKVYIVSPCHRWDNNIDSDINTYLGKTLREYSYGIADYSEVLNLPCKNLYKDGMINSSNRTTLLTDGVHRTIKGYRLLGEQYAKFIMSN